MKRLRLYINHRDEWELASEENCNIDPVFFTVNCEEIEYWGCPHGGKVPIANGEQIGYFSIDGMEIYLEE